jgi:hypothetical protein
MSNILLTKLCLKAKKVDFAQAKAVIRTILLRAKSTFYFEQ